MGRRYNSLTRLAIAMDLGTSGFRAQAIDLTSYEIISTAITTRHPLPGANVIDHIHFALEIGADVASSIVIRAVNNVIGRLHISADKVDRLAICGNPIQLSLFQGIEIRDLAYAGKRKLEALGVVPPKREATVLAAKNIPNLNLPGECDVIIPPAVRHEIGADALAMMVQTKMLEKEETSLTTDYGTNAEMALFHDGQVFTGSTAAGPALEGQQITCGMLAVPGAISNLNPEPPHHRVIVLNTEMFAAQGPLVNLKDGTTIEEGDICPVGITGTGTVAIMEQAMAVNLLSIPRINTVDTELRLGEDICFTEEDLVEAGKAIGSVRAGHITLCHEAGITLEDIRTAYMSGASGTYVDPLKAQKLGMVPSHVKTIYQVGNTSLAMARDLVMDMKKLDIMSDIANTLKKTHCMFASSKTFEKAYILEISYWTEGMPMSHYRKFLKRYGLPDLLPVEGTSEIVRTVKRDIDDLGRMGLTTITDIGKHAEINAEGCVACMECAEECPENAISVMEDSEPVSLVLEQSLCNGVACRRCERACPEKVFDLNRFFIK